MLTSFVSKPSAIYTLALHALHAHAIDTVVSKVQSWRGFVICNHKFVLLKKTRSVKFCFLGDEIILLSCDQNVCYLKDPTKLTEEKLGHRENMDFSSMQKNPILSR